jgi:glycyl-tRNA synthetase
MPSRPDAPTFQEIIFRLHRYWTEKGCLSWHPYHEVVGAGTGNPATLLRVLGPEPWSVAYVEPSFRPDDGRYGENPNRLQMHHQFQVILQPIPEDVQELYIGSLLALGVERARHDLRFVEDNWESPALGAWGLGWEVWLDGMEISQYTYFQQAGGVVLDPPACELTYGLERIAMYLQDVDSVWDLRWNEDFGYGEILKAQEVEYCIYDFEVSDVTRIKEMYRLFEEEAQAALDRGLVLPAYDYVLRCSHAFNLLDARGAVSVAERAAFFGRMRELTRTCSRLYAKQREDAGHPLLAKMPARPAPPVEGAPPAPEGARPFLIECGVEELPAGEVARLGEQLRDALVEALKAARLDFGEVRAYQTPRRLAVLVKDLAPRQEDLEEELKGPARAITEKNPKALAGFLKKAGVTEDAITWKEIKGTEYAHAIARTAGRPAGEVLAEVLPEVLRAPTAKRSMRWLASAHVEEAARLEFSRPVRWLCALLGEEVVPFAWGGLASGRRTAGPRYEEARWIEVPSAEHWEKTLLAAGIVPDRARRRELVRQGVEQLAREEGGALELNERLLDEVTDLVEYPMPFVGRYEKRFSSLPAPLLVGVMEKHQRYFALRGEDGRLLPAFIGVRNGREEHLDVVRAGNEKVIRARLSDAAYFFEKDRGRELAAFRPDLERLVFHEKLGSMLDKSERLRKLSRRLHEENLLPAVPSDALDRAATLAKCDLATQMVTEMTSLQGVMGRHYALASEESEEVAIAIEEHYLPRTQGDREPATALGRALGLSDRLDSLVGFFAAGVRPTGTGDPYGLRRDASGLLAILLAQDVPFSLDRALAAAADGLPLDVDDDTVEAVKAYVLKRLEVLLRERGAPADAARAVLARQGDSPAQAARAVAELEAFRQRPSFKETLEATSRCLRILRHAEEKGFTVADGTDAAKLGESAEQALLAALESIREEKSALASDEPQLVAALEALESLTPEITRFFDEVMVLCDEEEVRANRLSLVADVVELVERALDVMELEGA